MNLKDFRKVHEDEHKAILQNKKGHSFTIAKKQISEKQRNLLSQLPLHAADGTIVNQNEQQESLAPSEEINQTEQPDSMDRGLASVVNPVKAEEPVKNTQNIQPKEMTPQTPEEPQAFSNQQNMKAAEQYKKSYNDFFVEHASELGKSDAEFAQDLRNGHITPKTYKDLFAEKSTLGKIGTIFGLMVGGAGAGLSHQPNVLLDMMNKEIERDLEAQQKSKSNALDYLKVNQANQRNKAEIGRISAETTGKMAETKGQLIQNDILSIAKSKNQMMLAALKDLQSKSNAIPANSPLKAAFEGALNSISGAAANQIRANNEKASAEAASLSEQQFQAEQQKLKSLEMLGMPEARAQYEANQELHVPGFGKASNPPPESTRKELASKLAYDKAAKEYVEFAKENQFNLKKLNPLERQKIINKGAALAANLQNKYREKSNGGVWKAGEQEFIESVVPSKPEKWTASLNAIPKLEQTIHDNEEDTKAVASAYGIPFKGFGKVESKQNKDTGTKKVLYGVDTKNNRRPIISYDGGKTWEPR